MRGIINPTQALILGSLQSGKKSGAQIIAVARQIQGFWNSTRSQVYREMPNLEVKGYIKVIKDNVPAQYKELYQILPEGRKAYKLWLKENKPADLLRNPWVLRLVLAEHDGTDVSTLAGQASDYYRKERETLERDGEEFSPELGQEALISYYLVMEEWFTKQVV